jgi:hypothetical protein
MVHSIVRGGKWFVGGGRWHSVCGKVVRVMEERWWV